VHIGFTRDGFLILQSRCVLAATFVKLEGAQRADTSAKPVENSFFQKKVLGKFVL